MVNPGAIAKVVAAFDSSKSRAEYMQARRKATRLVPHDQLHVIDALKAADARTRASI